MNFLKKITPIVPFFIALSFNAIAQNEDAMGKRQKKIKALYIAFVSQEINLSESEAQQFWPIHNEFDKEIKEINQKKLSELDREEAILVVKKKYQERFKKIIGADRTDNFFRKDGEFRKKLIEKLKEKRMQNGYGPGKGGKRRQGMQPPTPPED